MYNDTKPGTKPIFIKIKHKKECFVYYTDEYELSGKIKKEISLLKNTPMENIRLFYPNRRIIEDHYTNHDQEVTHGVTLFVSFKYENANDFESFNDIALIGITSN